MWSITKRLSLGIVLITLAASVLLVSDWNRRRPSRAGLVSVDGQGHESGQGVRKKWNVHLVEYNDVLDVEEAEQGVLE